MNENQISNSCGRYTLEDFIQKLSSSDPAPGGGAASAVTGSCGAALVSMVCRLTIGNKKYAEHHEKMQEILKESDIAHKQFIRLADLDAASFLEFMQALKLPGKKPEEISIRKKAVSDAACKASSTPLLIMEQALSLISYLPELAEKGNRHAISDVAVAAELLSAALCGAAKNVLINLSSISDPEVREKFLHRTEKLQQDSAEIIMETKSRIKF